jgi:RNA polymerase sigma factor (sigma-70 family)
MDRTDSALIESCLNGNQHAWNALVDRYSRLVYSIPRRYRLSEADSDDVFQTVFLNLYRSLDRLKDQNKLSSWLITAAHRESWRVGRRNDQYPHLDEAFPSVSAPSDERIEEWERQHALHQGLTELGGRCEELLRALFLDRSDPSYEEVAKRLAMSVGSIGPIKARCCEKLERILRRMGPFQR